MAMIYSLPAGHGQPCLRSSPCLCNFIWWKRRYGLQHPSSPVTTTRPGCEDALTAVLIWLTCHFLFYAKLTSSFALPLPSLHPVLIRKLNMWIFHLNTFTILVSEDEGVFVCLLQGGGFGESTYGQPHSPEQPLHPGGSWEQLLSLTHRSENTECVSVWGPKGPGKCQFSGLFLLLTMGRWDNEEPHLQP